MESNDRFFYVTRDEFNVRMDKLEAVTQATHDDSQMTNARLEWMQTTIYWGFAIMGVIIAFVSFFVPMMFALAFRVHDKKESNSPNVIVYGAAPAYAQDKQPEKKEG